MFFIKGRRHPARIDRLRSDVVDGTEKSDRKTRRMLVDTLKSVLHFPRKSKSGKSDVGTEYCNSDLHDCQTIARDGIDVLPDELRDSQTISTNSFDVLPDELLLEIFSRAIGGLKSTLALSHVCRRFRTLLLSTESIWQSYTINSEWDYEQAVAIAKWSGLRHLKCTVCVSDPLSDSAAYIRSLDTHITELRLTISCVSIIDPLRYYLSGCSLPVLHTLIVHDSDFSYFPHFSYAPTYLYTPCHMPLLRVLDVDFLPLPWLGITLTRCSLNLIDTILPSWLIDFLAFSTSLRDLHIGVRQGFMEVIDTSNVSLATLPSLISFELRIWRPISGRCAQLLVDKIRPSALRSLTLEMEEDIAIEPIFTGYIQAFPLLQELSLEYRNDRKWIFGMDIAPILYYIPPLLERLVVSFAYRYLTFSWHRAPEDFKARQLQYFGISHGHLQDFFLKSLSDFFRDMGLNRVKFEFARCSGISPKDCTFPQDFRESDELTPEYSWVQ